MPTSTITRQLIINKIAERLSSIRIAAGYYTDSGTAVSEWRATPLHEGELGKSLSYRDPNDEPLEGSIQGDDDLMDRWLTVIISIPFRTLSGETIRKAIADVYKAIGTTTDGQRGETWSGLATLTLDLGNDLNVDQETKKIISVDITIRIQYRTRKWKES